MSLCQRTMLLAVVFVSCTLLLPTTLGRAHSRSDSRGTGLPTHRVYDEKEGERELIKLLQKIRERLDKDEGVIEEHFGSIHDDFNEERSLSDDVKSSRAESRGTGLHSQTVRLHDTTLTSVQQTQLVDAMNARRRSIGAADMYKLNWNAKLARLAQAWSDQCNFVHGYIPYNYDEYDNFTTVGANLWAYQGPFDASKIVDSWYNDKINFNRITQNCESDAGCGGYKQLVTSYTTDVGCGLSTCNMISSDVTALPNANFIVCYFGPPGNYREVATFTVGPPCTLCKYGQFYCDNGLCNKLCTSADINCVCQASCQLCSTQTSDCKCTCNKGSYGVNCGKPCADLDQNMDQKQCGKRGYTKDKCDNPNLQFVRDLCPLTCGLCSEGDPCSKRPN